MNQQELIPAAHAMKVTERGRVQGLSVAFARRAVSQSGAFREQLQRTLGFLPVVMSASSMTRYGKWPAI